MEKIYPKCLSAWRDLAFTSTGHLTPCCWVNYSFHEPFLKDLLTDEMHIDNFESIEEILTSKPWRDFYNMIQNNQDLAPSTCRHYCTGKTTLEDLEGKETFIGKK